jgi:Ala-tRNA(Pro) deacylase
MGAEEKVYEVLDNLGIEYQKKEHPPVYTVEEADEYWADLEGTHTKNLFFRNKKGKRHFLVILDSSKNLDIKSLQGKIGAGTLSFASDRRLSEHLGLSKGAVSVFGLINDEKKAVEVIVDSKLLKSDRIGFHPNVNTATITISTQDFKKFLESRGNKVSYKEL